MPPTHASGDSIAPQARASLAVRSGGTLLGLALALVLGLQLGALHWRYRREIWQLQGALVGAATGFVLGRLTARGRARRDPP
jgi:hypothetical protein